MRASARWLKRVASPPAAEQIDQMVQAITITLTRPMRSASQPTGTPKKV